MYIYIYIYCICIYLKNKNIDPLNYCSPQASRIQRFDFYFHARRRADICQHVQHIASFTKHVQNRVHAKILGQIDSK